MNKIVEIKSCSECPRATYVETQDPRVKRVYVGCELSHRSFDFNLMNSDPMPIQDWCQLPDAPESKRPRQKLAYIDGNGISHDVKEDGVDA